MDKPNHRQRQFHHRGMPTDLCKQWRTSWHWKGLVDMRFMFSSCKTNYIIKGREEIFQGTHLTDTKLQIHVSGKYFRTVSVSSSGVATRCIGEAYILAESKDDNSKQTRSTSASCFGLRKWQYTLQLEAVLAADACCCCSEHWYYKQWSFWVSVY